VPDELISTHENNVPALSGSETTSGWNRKV